MGYFDGNTVTALWNYAQHFAISDNFFASNFGESTRGALNLTAGDTYGVVCGPSANVYGDVPAVRRAGRLDGRSRRRATATSATLNVDADPYWDVCSEDARPSAFTGATSATCSTRPASPGAGSRAASRSTRAAVRERAIRSRRTIARSASIRATDPLRFADYVPHHNPFQYFASTANPRHLPPTSVDDGRAAPIKRTTCTTCRGSGRRREAGNLPTVSFLKAPAYQNGHPGNSTPLDEQTFLVRDAEPTAGSCRSGAAWR